MLSIICCQKVRNAASFYPPACGYFFHLFISIFNNFVHFLPFRKPFLYISLQIFADICNLLNPFVISFWTYFSIFEPFYMMMMMIYYTFKVTFLDFFKPFVFLWIFCIFSSYSKVLVNFPMMTPSSYTHAHNYTDIFCI